MPIKNATNGMTLDQRYPAIADLEATAYARIPRIASEYLRGGVGNETGLQRNQRALSEITFSTRYLAEKQTHQPNLQTTILDQTFALPFGISPIGLSGLMWPGAVNMLARSARRANIPMVRRTISHWI